MIIQNLELLKSWLTSKLEPICDADPAALAKYVAALVKKDKPEDDLRDVCIDQLEVFLGDKTIAFVGTLFEALKNNSYVTVTTNFQSVKEVIQKGEPEILKRETEVSPVKDERFESSPDLIKSQETVDVHCDDINDLKDNVVDSNDNQKVKYESNSNLPSVEGSRKRHSSDHSSKGSKDTSPTNRTLDRDHSRSKYARKESKDTLDNSNETTKLLIKESDSKVLSADKDLNKDGKEGRHTLRPKVNSSPRYSPSPDRHKRRYPYKHKEHRDYRNDHRDRRGKDDKPPIRKRGRCKDYEEKGYCILGESCPYDHGKDPVIVNDINFGMDLFAQPSVNPHLPVPSQLPGVFPRLMPSSTSLMLGTNPLQPLGSSSNLGMNSGVNLVIGQMRPVPSPLELPPRLPYFPPRLPVPPDQQRPRSKDHHFEKDTVSGSEAYNPEQPLIKPEEKQKLPVWMRLGLGKEAQTSAKVEREVSPQNSDAQPVYIPASVPSSKSGPYQRHQKKPFQNQTTLEIRKIPQALNNVVKLSEYFQKFGKIVNVQVKYDNDTDAALVQFESNFEARRAYTSPEAVFGNRFIKTFWHRGTLNAPSDQKVRVSSAAAPVTSHPETTSNQTCSTTSVVSEGVVTKSYETGAPSVAPKNTLTSVSRGSSHHASTKLRADKKREVMKKKLEIQKQRQNLLEKQIKEQKVLITKLEKSKKISATDKEVLLKAIKTITASVEKLRTEIEEEAKAAHPKTKQTIEKELLDYEMDLFHKMQNGEDSHETRQRIDELRQEAKSLGMRLKFSQTQHRGSGRGRRKSNTVFNPTPTSTSQVSAFIDNRPRQLLVSDFDIAEKQAILNNFKEGCDVERIEEREGGKLVIVFHTRKQAEIAVSRASSFPGKKLSLAWYTGNLKSTAIPATRTSTSSTNSVSAPAKISRTQSRTSISSVLSKGEDADLLLDLDEKEEDLLLGELEEDDDEDEERSWRR